MFLEALARHMIESHGSTMESYVFIFPNRRSGLFFKQFLVKQMPGTQWSPRIITIAELMQELSGSTLADPIDMLIGIYQAYCQVNPFPESFDEFYPWGEMMLSDFDTIDKYLADPESIFTNIRELKEIDEQFGSLDEDQVEFIRKFWKNFHQGETTNEKEVFISTWNQLTAIYRIFKSSLAERNTGYEGMLYRKVANMGIAELDRKLEGKYIFAGLNALSSSEKKLLMTLKKRDQAMFFWDYDERYLADETMDAGKFLRENIQLFPPSADLGVFQSLSQPPDFRIFDLPSDVLQAKTVHKIISERDSSITAANDTAIVACDENLLMPVLFSLPDQVDMVNITMGYPFKNTPLFGFIDSLIRMHRNVRDMTDGSAGFYYKDVLSVLNHATFKQVTSVDPLPWVEKITRENHVYVTKAVLKNSSLEFMLGKLEHPADFISFLEKLLETMLQFIHNAESEWNQDLEREYILLVLGRLNKLERIADKAGDLDLHLFFKLFRRIISGQRIPFTGEPLAGLQIMGILETRLLDFEHVIMLSVNEEIMPDASGGYSFIPYSLRRAYGLPTREEMDAIYAYYFYRVIQRARRVDLLYKSAANGIRSGEMSRYLYQVKYDYKTPVIRPSLPITASEKKSIKIEKSVAIMQILDKYSGEGKGESYLSPSALNTYLECSLKFYFRKILQIGEQDELREELDPIGFGNILHGTIQHLYEETLDEKGILHKQALNKLSSSGLVDTILHRNFREEYFRSASKRKIEGRNLIILAILKKYLLKIIHTDLQHAPLRIHELEAEYSMQREITINGNTRKIRLGGMIDRIDNVEDDLIRIIDYKSGKAKLEFPSVESLFDSEGKSRNREAFQAMMYCSLYLSDHQESLVQPGLYVIRDLYRDDYSPVFKLGTGRNRSPVNTFNAIGEEFTSHLDHLLGLIFDPAGSFSQTEDVSRCKNCDFRRICERD